MPIPLTKEVFIEKSKNVHGDDAFDYSKVVWKNTSTEVTLICKKCGKEFSVKPDKHINRKRGCDCQSLHKKRSYNSFIEEVSLKLPKYFQNVSVVNYNELCQLNEGEFLLEKTKITLRCEKCGHEWNTNAKRILNGQGCPKCAGKCENTDSFLHKLEQKQPELFKNIDIIGEYIGSNKTITVKCKKCGYVWEPIAYNLLSGKSHCLCDGGKLAKHNENTIREKLEDSNWECISLNKFKCKTCGEILDIPYRTMLSEGCHCPSCDDNARWHTAVYYENELKRKFGDDLTFEWENDNILKKNTDILCVYRNGVVLCKKQLKLFRNSQNIESKNIKIDEAKYLIQDVLIGRNFTLLSSLNDIINQYDEIICKCNVCGTITRFKVVNVIHGSFGCKRCQYDSVKRKKFNLLEEFVDEYNLREWLTNADIYIVYIILRNLSIKEPEFGPIIKDITNLINRGSDDPIRDLENKYSKLDEESNEDEIETTTDAAIEDIDLDDDGAVEAVIKSIEDKEKKSEPTIGDIVKSREAQIHILNEIEHMLTPDELMYVNNKYLNDKRREWMLERDKS